jgi:hypothetical protein
MNITTVGIDLAKNVFSVHGVDAHGKVMLEKTVSRGKLLWPKVTARCIYRTLCHASTPTPLRFRVVRCLPLPP